MEVSVAKRSPESMDKIIKRVNSKSQTKAQTNDPQGEGEFMETKLNMLERKIYSNNQIVIESTDEGNAKERYLYLVSKYRKEIDSHRREFKMNDYAQKEEEEFCLFNLIKTAWASGKTTQHLRRDLGLKDDANTHLSRFFAACIKALKQEVSSLDSDEVYAAFTDRSREIINRLDRQANLIERFWNDNPDRSHYLHKEYMVLQKMIFDMEVQVINTGKDMGVIGVKEADRNIFVNFAGNLLPDSGDSKPAVEQITGAEKKMIEDRNGVVGSPNNTGIVVK